jgi:hypothetical protein
MESGDCSNDTISTEGQMYAGPVHAVEDDFLIPEADFPTPTDNFLVPENSSKEEDREHAQDHQPEKKKRPRLLWNFVKFYAHHEEDQAKVFIINEFTSPGFPLAKDQPYYCQNKLVQTFKCSVA